MKPVNETAEFARRFNLEYGDAQYLHSALTFYRSALICAQAELKAASPAEGEQLARELMRAAMAAKYQPDFPRLYGLQEVIGNMASTLECGLGDLAEAVGELSKAHAAGMRESAEACSAVADRCRGIDSSIEALRRMVDTYGDALYRQAAIQGRGR